MISGSYIDFMHLLFIPTIIFVGGWYFLFRNIRCLNDQTKLEGLLTKSLTVKYCAVKFGNEKTIELSKKYFLPAGVIVAIIMICISSWDLFRLLPLIISIK